MFWSTNWRVKPTYLRHEVLLLWWICVKVIDDYQHVIKNVKETLLNCYTFPSIKAYDSKSMMWNSISRTLKSYRTLLRSRHQVYQVFSRGKLKPGCTRLWFAPVIQTTSIVSYQVDAEINWNLVNVI